jgi:Cd2+/Zn2+-exporting ATPase
MDCAEEVSLLRGQLSRVEGVRDLAFDIFKAKIRVEYDPARLRPERIAEAVAAVGMRCEPWSEEDSVVRPRGDHWREKIFAVVSGCALAAGITWESILTGDAVRSLLVHEHARHYQLPSGILALFWIAMAAGAVHALPKAWTALRRLRFDMNALMVLSLAGATALGEWTEAATLSFLFSLATLLEAWSLARARQAISSLLRVTPPMATVLHAGSEHGSADHGHHEHPLPVSQVPVGSLVRVKPGERVPFDGEVVRGTSLVNQALITGESVAVEKEPGDTVFAGTMNEEGSLEIRTARPAADTTLARMIRMVEQSQSRRAPTEQFVEKFTRYYTPAVFLMAFSVAVLPPLFGGGGWAGWFYQAMVILLISCPCALVISTPVSIVAALTSAARNGVLIKGGAYLEEAAKIRAVAFDKTGILTAGRPEVQELVTVNGHSREEVLRRVAVLEQSSEHPLARAIVRHAARENFASAPAQAFRAVQGRGVEAEIGGRSFWVGSARMLREKGLETDEVASAMGRLADYEHTVVACGTDEDAWALLRVADPLRTGAPAAVSETRAAGVRSVVMLTGDSEATARQVGQAVGVDSVEAELLPEDKAARVVDLKRRYHHVAMLGDGINDAQALSSASVGIAFGRHGTDVARETADVVFMASDLSRLPFLLRHARRTVRVIQENIALALALKLMFLVAALSGFATLWMAVAADMGATFLVTFNGLRLLRVKAGGPHPSASAAHLKQ